MKKQALIFLLFFASFAQAQFFFGINGFYSRPLANFEKDKYSNGLGLELGLCYQLTLSDPWRLELNSHWQWGDNGSIRSETALETHRLTNAFNNWHGEVKLLYHTERWTPYIGIHLGTGRYRTNELINYIVTSDDNDFSKSTIHSRSLFQGGLSIGTYLKLTENTFMDFGISTNLGDQGINYFEEDSYRFENDEIKYTSIKSRPVLLLFNVGFILKLRKLDYKSTSGDHTDDQPRRVPQTPKKKNPHSRE